ncbi:CsgG/HfaB family protein [Rhodopirellula europaea]|uniref:CsgG/HfaB family protein n=1 Tax=Rhodopirellula europaea TaxID=1263866 RepID=UPI0003479190|nr:CsgG/HfaB family protein [Rhodopirellula europaea]
MVPHAIRSLAFRHFLFVFLFGNFACPPVSAQVSSPPLFKVILKDNSEPIIGTLLKQDPTSVTIQDIHTKTDVNFERSNVKEVVTPFAFDDAVESIGLTEMLSWKIAQVAAQRKQPGRIAKVSSQVIYVTLGTNSGIREGTKLDVFRNEGEIKDPVSGEVIAVERPKIAEIQVVETHEKYSKAKLFGNLEPELEVGDEVEPNLDLRVAVCPIRDQNGNTADETLVMAEDLTTRLVNRRVPVVDRESLGQVLDELLVQNSILFDPKTARKLGNLTGATHVVAGKIVPNGRTRGIVYARLIDVQTGRIVIATSTSISLPRALAGSAPNRTMEQRTPARTVRTGNSLGESRSLPSFLTTRSRYQKGEAGGIRIQGYNEFTYRNQGVIFTKDIGCVSRDFTFEVVLQFGPEDMAANIGLGYGVADRSYNGLKDSVYLRLYSPSMRSEPGVVKLNRFKLGEEIIGELATAGPHLVRITKQGDTVTFQVDSGNDGPSDDDFETTIANIREFAPFLHSKNSPLFFAGAGEFIGASISK